MEALGALSDDVGFLVARASAVAVAAGNAALLPFGLRARSYSVLALVAGGTRLSQRALADLLRLDPSQVVALVDELERAGLVRRESDPADRRTKLVVATEEGQRRARDAGPVAGAAVSAPVDPAERELLVALLRRLAFPEVAASQVHVD